MSRRLPALADHGNKGLRSERILIAEELQAIVSVAVESSYPEHLLELAIWSVCSMETPLGEVFTANTTMGPKAQMLRKVLAASGQEEVAIDDFESIFAEIDAVVKDRNTVVHG